MHSTIFRSFASTAVMVIVSFLMIGLAFGVVSYLLKLYKFNIVPIVLGMILGSIAEQALQQGLILYKNDLGAMFATFFHRPICIMLMALMVLSVCVPFILDARKKKKAAARQQ